MVKPRGESTENTSENASYPFSGLAATGFPSFSPLHITPWPKKWKLRNPEQPRLLTQGLAGFQNRQGKGTPGLAIQLDMENLTRSCCGLARSKDQVGVPLGWFTRKRGEGKKKPMLVFKIPNFDAYPRFPTKFATQCPGRPERRNALALVSLFSHLGNPLFNCSSESERWKVAEARVRNQTSL